MWRGDTEGTGQGFCWILPDRPVGARGVKTVCVCVFKSCSVQYVSATGCEDDVF